MRNSVVFRWYFVKEHVSVIRWRLKRFISKEGAEAVCLTQFARYCMPRESVDVGFGCWLLESLLNRDVGGSRFRKVLPTNREGP